MMPENDTSTPNTAPMPAPIASTAAPAARPPRQRLALIIAALALALSAWQALEGRRLAAANAEFGAQLQAILAQQQQERSGQPLVLQQLESERERLQSLEGKVDGLAALAESLSNPSQELARSRDEALLLEVEQAITLAAQQLQLAGNAPVALLALQSADARLGRVGGSQWLPLRKALAKDSERLRALPRVDLPGMSLRLEQVLLGVDKLPLSADLRPASVAATPAPSDENWWQRNGRMLWQEVRDLIRIQRFDRTDAALMAPGQAFFLRENLKLRLLNARLALLSREPVVLRNELKAAEGWLERYFQVSDGSVQDAVQTLRQMQGAELNAALPSLNESQTALNELRAARDKR